MLNRDQLKAKLIQAISTTLAQSNMNIIDTLYESFAKEIEKRLDNMSNINDILFDAFETIAKLYGIDFTRNFNLKDIDQHVTALLQELDKQAKSTTPKQRYLSFCITDDCGHTNCFVITEKDKELVDLILSSHDENLPIYEYVNDTSQIILALSTRYNTVPEDLLELGNELYKIIDRFFDEIINDDSISVETFSTCLASLLNTERHSGNAYSWVLL